MEYVELHYKALTDVGSPSYCGSWVVVCGDRGRQVNQHRLLAQSQEQLRNAAQGIVVETVDFRLHYYTKGT